LLRAGDVELQRGDAGQHRTKVASLHHHIT
jgi:hypothetical protein